MSETINVPRVWPPATNGAAFEAMPPVEPARAMIGRRSRRAQLDLDDAARTADQLAQALRRCPSPSERGVQPRIGGDLTERRPGRRGALLVDREAVRTPPAIPASALPVSLRAVSVNRTTASAIIGTITSRTKNSRSLARKSTRRQTTLG